MSASAVSGRGWCSPEWNGALWRGDALRMKLISWNLLRLTGASLRDVARLIAHEQPDLMLMQEATHDIDALPSLVGGGYARVPLPGRIHGLAMWTPGPLPSHPVVIPLPAGAVVQRVCQMMDMGAFTIVNVHLSHGQLLNRRQLRRIARRLPPRAAIIGDYNLVGPVLLPGFHDVGPRRFTHMSGEIMPLRLDRCIVRGLVCTEQTVLPRGPSDHRPIMMRLTAAPLKIGQQQPNARVA
jgi:endonuclease/exonuclease/phosphatase (EEP) superfamily protein YafD